MYLLVLVVLIFAYIYKTELFYKKSFLRIYKVVLGTPGVFLFLFLPNIHSNNFRALGL